MPADYTDGFVVREPAWHGLATVLGDYPTMGNLWSGDPTLDPYILAGHDFDIEEVELYMKQVRHTEGVGDIVTFPRLAAFRAMRNSKTGTVFQVAKDSTGAIGNKVGWELIELMLNDPAARVATAGVLKDGAVCWVLVELDEPLFVVGDDSPTYPYLNCHWYHDGTGALRLFQTAIRTVCINTLDYGWMTAEKGNVAVSLRHTKNVKDRIEDVKLALSGARSAIAEYADMATDLAQLHVTDEQRELFVKVLIPEPVGDVVSDKVRENIAKDRAKVRSIFDSTTIPDQHRNTAYGLVQAGVEYLDWLRGYRNQDTLFGRQLLRSEPMKTKLVPMVRELVDA